MDNENEKLDAARKYVDACKQHGPTAERERMHDALYKTPGCKIYIGKNRSIIDEMRNCLPHTTKDVHDATATAIHVDIPRENEFIREEKTAKRQLDAELEIRIREFGEKNGFPVIYVLTEKVVSNLPTFTYSMTIDGKMYLFRFSDVDKAAAFADRHNGIIGMYEGPLPGFCIAHHCTERGPKCDRCAYIAMSSSERRKMEA